MPVALISFLVGTAIYLSKLHLRYFRVRQWAPRDSAADVQAIGQMSHLSDDCDTWLNEGVNFRPAIEKMGGIAVVERLRENTFTMLHFAAFLQSACPGSLQATIEAGVIGPHAELLSRELGAIWWLHKTRTELPSSIYQLKYALELYSTLEARICAFVASPEWQERLQTA